MKKTELTKEAKARWVFNDTYDYLIKTGVPPLKAYKLAQEKYNYLMS